MNKEREQYLIDFGRRLKMARKAKNMTLQELAAFMVRLGAKEALNLDGGGSSEMVIKGSIVWILLYQQREISDSLLVISNFCKKKSSIIES